jgi:hypothetical protein
MKSDSERVKSFRVDHLQMENVSDGFTYLLVVMVQCAKYAISM